MGNTIITHKNVKNDQWWKDYQRFEVAVPEQQPAEIDTHTPLTPPAEHVAEYEHEPNPSVASVELAYETGCCCCFAAIAVGWYSHWNTEVGRPFASLSGMQLVPAAAEEQNALIIIR